MDLFGNPIPQDSGNHGFKVWKEKYRYRFAEGADRCEICKNLDHVYRGNGHYYKCELLGDSASSATDIRLNHVCDLVEVDYQAASRAKVSRKITPKEHTDFLRQVINDLSREKQ